MSDWDVVFDTVRARRAAASSRCPARSTWRSPGASRRSSRASSPATERYGVVDLSAVEFIDSSGIRELLKAQSTAQIGRRRPGAAAARRRPAAACSRSAECGAISRCSKRRRRRGGPASKVSEWRSRETLSCTWHLMPRACGEGRRFVAETLRDWHVDEARIEPVLLVANELVANAIVHARSAPSLSLEEDGHRPDAARRRHLAERAGSAARPPWTQSGGRGLIMVEALADRWGIDAHSSGKVVWVTFTDAFG